jgi:GTP-binding protein HflX
LNADIIIHLIDLSHPDHVAQEKSVDEILAELAPENMLHDMIKIYNKCDRIKNFDQVVSAKRAGSDSNSQNSYFISCQTGYGIADLKKTIESKIYKKLNFIQLKLKIGQGSDEMAFLYKNSIVQEMRPCDEDSQFIVMNILINKVNALKFINLYPNIKISK